MKQYKIQYYREILSSYIKTVDKNFLSTPFSSQERKLKIRSLKDLVKISLDFPFFSRWRIKSREGNKDLLGGELNMIINYDHNHNLKKIGNTDWTDEEKKIVKMDNGIFWHVLV